MTNIEHAVEAARHDGDFGVMFLARAVGDLQKQIEQLPQQRKPLTDEQIYDMYNEPRSDAEMLAFARAIEAAHGIKE